MMQLKNLLIDFFKRKFSISVSVVLLVILPIAGLIHLSSEKMYRNIVKFSEVKEDALIADFEIAISNLIFTLQRERGRTHLYLGNSDEERKSKLLSIYNDTDNKINVIDEKMEKLNKKETLSVNSTIINQLKIQLKEVRHRIQNGQINPDEAFNFYKAIVIDLMKIRYSLIHQIKDRELLISLFKNLILSEIVEVCGQERALVSFQIASGETNLYKEEIMKAHSSETFFEDLYLKLASNQERERFIRLKESSKVEKIKDNLLSKTIKNVDDSEYWWKVSTERIESIIGFINYNLEGVIKRLNSIKRNSFLELAISSIQLSLTLIITVLIAFRIVKYIEGQIFYDTLTGLPNRRFFYKELELALNRAERYGEVFSLALFDIDDFKFVNDNYGHDLGDAVLREVGNIIRKNIRKSDIPARYGGEEFIVLFTNTSIEDAHRVAERIRESINESNLNLNEINLKISISGGITNYVRGTDMESLIKEADEALYKAKRTGKNRIVINEQKQQGG